MRSQPRETASSALHALASELAELSGAELIAGYVERAGIDGLAYVSSFGAESAVLLHLVSVVDPAIPVLFINTGRLFDETLDYREQLIAELGLVDVREIGASELELARLDPDGDLHRRDPDRCCAVRKVEPLRRALQGRDAWISGRKQYHGGQRTNLPTVELDGPRLKLNPLATWTADDLRRYFEDWKLPAHPLVERGYASIGCEPCTSPVQIGDGPRTGRWRGQRKTECGIHGHCEQRA